MNPERILVRGVNWLGDAVMSTPALLRLREARPAAHISLLTPEKLADLWHTHPAVDAVLSFSPEESVRRIGQQLRQQQFDIGLILPNSPRSALELWLGRVPRRIGYATPWRGWFLTERVAQRAEARPMRKRRSSEIHRLIAQSGDSSRLLSLDSRLPPTAHHLHQYLHLVGALGGRAEPLPPLLFVPEPEARAVGRKLGLMTEPPDARPLFGLNPGAEYGPAKRWPRERFVAAALAIQRQADCRWAIFGGPDDIELARGLANELTQRASTLQRSNASTVNTSPSPSVLSLAGRTSLRELCAALTFCRVLLTNDTGPMHLAAAVGTPVVALFGSTSPELTGPGLPGGARHRLLRGEAPCSPCFRRECPIDFRCMTSISVERVVQAVLAAAGI